MNDTAPIALAWLRRELRLHDNAVLHAAQEASPAVQPVFVFDIEILARFTNPQDRRLSFIAHALCAMHAQLQKHGAGLLVLHGKPQELIPQLAEALSVTKIICAEDAEPATRRRDEAVKNKMGAGRFEQVLDHLIHAPDRVLKDDGTPYRVFTPFSKAWHSKVTCESFEEKTVTEKGFANFDMLCHQLQTRHIACINPSQGVEVMLQTIGYRPADLGEWKVETARDRLERFITRDVTAYKDCRDFMAQEGTSKLSPYLRFGLVSPRECGRLAIEKPGAGSETWIKEIIWREFYAMILGHFPDVVDKEFQEQYRGLAWEDDAKKLLAWQQGKTGYPIVDAAMRQLTTTGWMHNRARMIVASFFTKDLHLDWRLGEEFFAQHLMDYDLASNNGGWQWAASTGTDAQPYFRVFNPELQAKKFDPKAEYIKRFVPELKSLDAESIFALHRGDSLLRPADYPAPIVDHFAAKDKAIAMFKQSGEAA